MIPFYRPYFDHRELQALLQTGGASDVKEFEAKIASMAGARYALSFAYGRIGFVALMKALEIPSGEVILPAYTCLVMAHAVLAAGHRPVFVDINLDDFNLDISQLKESLSPSTRAVVATHMFGYPADVDAIRKTIGDHKILLIEDAALSTHILSPDSAGLRGDAAIISLGMNKPLSTIEGGVIITNSASIYSRLRDYQSQINATMPLKAALKRWARFLSSYVIFSPKIYKHWYQRVVLKRPEFNNGLSSEFLLPPNYLPADGWSSYAEFQARIGLVQLAKLTEAREKRRAIAQSYHQALRYLPGIHLPPLHSAASYSYYTLRLPQRNKINFRTRMAQQGVGVDQSFDYALPNLENYKTFSCKTYPCATQAAAEVVNFPCYPNLQPSQMQTVINAARKVLSTAF